MRAWVITIVGLLGGTAVRAHPQAVCTQSPPILVGSEWEQYLRVAQVSGKLPLSPWTVRDFGPREWEALVPNDSTLPWSTSMSHSRTRCIGSLRIRELAPRLQLFHNTRFPFGENDGAVWQGRGLTVAGDAGVSATYGPLTVTFAPMVFAAQNENFTIQPNGLSGTRVFADWLNPSGIDLPQRFGSGRYTAFDLGESSARIDIGLLAFGLSNAHQFWGPATDHPIILGNNAAGFPHAFLGSSRPIRLWRFGSVHGRILWGKLGQSRYSPLADTSLVRLGSSLAVVFQPAVAPGLEIGGTRFFHVLQDRFRLDRNELLRPFGALTEFARAHQTGGTGVEPDNQLSSVFARYVLPGSGAEFYGEYGREDRSLDMRDFVLMPDHDAAYLLGMRKLWNRAGSMLSLRAEILNSRITHLGLSSTQAPWYVHSTELQGHTNRGQALGSAAAYGGGSSLLALERYDGRGRWRVSWERVQLGQQRVPAPDMFLSDVAHSFGASVLRFGRRADVDLGVAAVYEINRHFAADAFNLHTTVSLRPPTRRSRP